MGAGVSAAISFPRASLEEGSMPTPGLEDGSMHGSMPTPGFKDSNMPAPGSEGGSMQLSKATQLRWVICLAEITTAGLSLAGTS